jgi:hypothetical protein
MHPRDPARKYLRLLERNLVRIVPALVRVQPIRRGDARRGCIARRESDVPSN